MPPGPLQLLVIGSDPHAPRSWSLAAPALRTQRQIRLVDVLGVHKDEEGAIWSVEVPGLEAAQAMQSSEAGEPGCGALVALLGLAAQTECSPPATPAPGGELAPADILEIAARIPPGGDALLLLFEHSWLRDLAEAIHAGGGWVAGGFLDRESLRTLAAEVGS